jgi:transposase
MQVVYERCCGLDVHKKVVVACLMTLTAKGQRHKEIRRFGTMTRDLLMLLDWLRAAGWTHIALESTGVYWRPIFNILEGEMTVLLVNAAHIKAVPGRKTDRKDAEWIADLLQHGLLRPSFIPPAPQRELRELTRSRSSLVADCARIIHRFQKVLEETNLKLASVVTDVTGVSARALLRAYLSGEETDPWELANLARGSLRGKQVQLAQAMVGEVKEHHRFLLLQQMALIEILEKQIAQFDQKIAERIEQDEEEKEMNQPPSSQKPSEATIEASSSSVVHQGLEGYAKALARLDGIPGVKRRGAEIVLAEIGITMEQFPSDGHLASWAGMCPGSKVSAGKR